MVCSIKTYRAMKTTGRVNSARNAARAEARQKLDTVNPVAAMIKRLESMWAEELKAQEKTRWVALRAAAKAKKAVAVAKGKALAIADRIVQPSKQTLRLVGKNPLHIYRADWLDQRRARGIHTPRLFSMWDDVKRDFGALTADQRRQYDERLAKARTVARHNRNVEAAAASAVAVFMSKAVAKGEAKAARTLRRLPEGDRKDRELLLFKLRKYGFTEGCLGCVYAHAGATPAKSRSQRCGNRIVEAMKRDRSDAVKVEESDRRRQKMRKEKNEPVLYAPMLMDTGGASSSFAGPVAASTPTSSTAAGPTLDAEMGDSVDIDTV
jgi:hypothetical protein